MDNVKGITLIEILVAMAILAIIAGIALPAYRGYITTGHKTECQNEVSAIKLAEAEFFLENNAYFIGPDTATLAANSQGTYTPSTAASSAKSECTYSVIAAGKNYTITANYGTGGHLTGETNPILTFTGP